MKISASTSLMDCQFERALPNLMIVDKESEGFTNEAQNYNSVGHNILKRQNIVEVVPAYLIMDKRHRMRYPLGLMPGRAQQVALDAGLVIRADALQQLAEKLGISAKGLKKSVDRFKSFRATGVDSDFGTKRGILTDQFGRVWREEGEVMEGFYATGNCSASVMGRTYAEVVFDSVTVRKLITARGEEIGKATRGIEARIALQHHVSFSVPVNPLSPAVTTPPIP
ncbi:hypothetical protein K469DRAFT_753896 [Zopfia rhizophila CBS 207.26]|uniref:FAD-dependent oxidoreductase 2 FAD-binding domain-containing protein n=1 Tax=Zopfia rhizophila CBS 207.26 TaxID=1314779 RepID=A0A6A6DJ33_9PEZI|nr:hypothetical protein K469DRAFT_753896 [Zopfia rhizophila CBS 207.26]